MTEKINVAEILKSKPRGTMLYDKARNISVYLRDVIKINDNSEIYCTFDIGGVQILKYSSNGTLLNFENGMVILTPSKKMCDWEKFTWKKGDLLVCYEGMKPSYTIFDSFENNTYKTFKGKFSYDGDEDKWYRDEGNLSTNSFRKMSRADSKNYVIRIEEHFDGKLNHETLEIEKPQPEFKDGDILARPDSSVIGKNYVFILREFDKYKNYKYYVAFTGFEELDFPKYDAIYSLRNKNVRFATEEEKQQLFDALAVENKAWDAEKKMIVDLKPRVELKPFDKVLVRNRNTHRWEADLFGFKSEGYDTNYHCVGSIWKFCIPYIGNESLLGTIKDVKG